jgi:hypothetical protein
MATGYNYIGDQGGVCVWRVWRMGGYLMAGVGLDDEGLGIGVLGMRVRGLGLLDGLQVQRVGSERKAVLKLSMNMIAASTVRGHDEMRSEFSHLM